ncbi:glycoside hydrolase family 2 TIM barrel-domain containing protein [Fulvimonas sp. R45]|uniref:glycoside hydrolase family 2 protein n=1 Tax=Fulvimonas sp. R45 TaxID=3045937 RepID=UPI00265FC80E|nr:glycoside hydrolase family 2 TIM barrel-domain containing protein [Fulvimonas sp. R45]MDO1528762.1 glycoside hydrolase family 2 TIM barrel-domain containing protein [Fulvimonas sp. R45]
MRILAASLLLTMVALAAASAAHAGTTFAPTRVDGGAGATTAVAHWQIQSSAKAQQDGVEISSAGFSTKGWYPVSGRATVMAGLLENGVYKDDVFHGDNLRAVQVPDASGNLFVNPWWYRTEFTLADGAPGLHTLLRAHGIIASADVWVNGHRVADHATVAGAYPVHELDVTRWVHAGRNVLALRVHPGDPRRSLSIGWVDWNPTPPDNNMGPWRGVDIVRSGPVQLRFPRVIPALSLPALDHAALTVKVEARNLDAVAHEATITGEVAGVALRRTIRLDPGQAQTVSFTPKTDPGLDLSHPKIWWPVGMGAHPLYALKLAATVDGAASDRAGTSFGIRSVSSRLTRQGYRQFLVNGRPVLIRGAGWAPDMFLRDDPARMEAEFSYVRNLGLNTIRSEGKLEDARFYDLADRDGIMVLAGWECCDKWESAAKTGGAPWDAADEQVAADSMASEARLLRNHPSVIGFLIGSDNAPPPEIAKMYVDTLRAEDWAAPIIAAASDQATAETGPSGMKMTGPYAWVPPAYWYADRLGGAFGFNSETGAGADIPRLEDLVRMLSPQEREALWKYPQVRQYHASAAWSPFASLAPFDTALARRYGAPRNLADYVAKAQLDNYDNTRAQFEAFSAHMDAAKPSTGVIYWMLNNAWPSLHWHLYDYYLNPAGAYFGARKANEPVHIQYAYDSRAVVLVNHTPTDARGLQADIRVRDLDGSVRYQRHLQGIDLAGHRTRSLATLPAPAGLSSVYFVELELASADGKPVSRNVYWLSTRPDELDWAHSNWYLTPLTQYADLTALQSLPAATSEVRATLRHTGAGDEVAVTLTVPASSRTVALFQHVSIRRSPGGEPVLPILWSDNDVTLWPGESLTLIAHCAGQGTAPVVEVDGWNVPTRSFPVVVGNGTGAPREKTH